MAVVRIDDSLAQRLEALSKTTNHSKTFYANKALRQFLEDQEDYLVALSRFENVQKGASQTYSMEEIARALNLPLP